MLRGGRDSTLWGATSHIPPNDLSTLATIAQAWNECPTGHTPFLRGDLNVNLGAPRDDRDEQIAELVEDEMGLCDLCDLSKQIPSKIPWVDAGEMDVEDEKGWEVDILPM